MRRAVGWARVSSAEQAEGYSLQAQEEKIRAWAKKNSVEIVRMFVVPESANVPKARMKFREMLDFAKDKKANQIDLLLFDRIDRATRSLADLAQLEILRIEYGVDSISTDVGLGFDTAHGEMTLGMLATAAHFANRLSTERIRENVKKRAEAGWPVGWAPYGYENFRENGRAMVRVHRENAARVLRVFNLVAYEGKSLEDVKRILFEEGIDYTTGTPKFPKSTLHKIIHDRAYIGEIRYHGQWLPGCIEPIVDRKTFLRAQEKVSRRKYTRHELIYSHRLIRCVHCDRFITGDRKEKSLGDGSKATYVYYRCAGIATPGHPRVRLREEALDRQVKALFDSFRVKDDEVRAWFVDVLLSHTREMQAGVANRRAAIAKELTRVSSEKDKLLRLHLAGEVEGESYGRIKVELRDREAILQVQLEQCAEDQSAQADSVVKVFELTQDLAGRWDAGGVAEKRQILDFLSSNWLLEGETLVPELRLAFLTLQEAPQGLAVEDGAPGGIRTHDPRFRKRLLYRRKC